MSNCDEIQNNILTRDKNLHFCVGADGRCLTEDKDAAAVESEKPILPIPLLLLLADRLRPHSRSWDWVQSLIPQLQTTGDAGLAVETGQRPRGNVDGRPPSVTHKYTIIMVIITYDSLG